MRSGLTHRAKLLGRVHGVVVHATRETPGSLTNGKATITETLIDRQVLLCNKLILMN